MQIRPLVIGATLALAGAALVGPAVSAQEMAPTPHPAHIHVGTCPAPGDVVAPLTDVALGMAGEMMGPTTAIAVESSVTSVPIALGDIIAGGHAIVVHASAEDMGTYLLCGDIGGYEADGTLAVGLGPVADSGYAGIAWLTDGGDGTTSVTLQVIHAGGMMEAPAA